MWSFDYDVKSGAVSNRRELTTFDTQPGLPDGSCVDAAGCIWNAQWNGGRVVRFTPDGRVDQIVPVPVPNPTCVAFGGASLDTLYITTARYLMTPEQVAAAPHSGRAVCLRARGEGIGGAGIYRLAGTVARQRI